MDNNFPVIHLGIHNITQENFYMASGGLYHDILFVFFKSGTPFYVMDCLCHNLFQFFIGKWLHQILEEKIKKLLPDAVIDKYLSGDELIASGSKPDILFLDIQMPGMDGMETAKVLRQDNENMILIFVTAAEEYVFQAFDVGAFQYPYFVYG